MLFGKVNHFVNLAFLAFSVANKSEDFCVGAFHFFAFCKGTGHGNSDSEWAGSIPNSIHMAGDVTFENAACLAKSFDDLFFLNVAHFSECRVDAG